MLSFQQLMFSNIRVLCPPDRHITDTVLSSKHSSAVCLSVRHTAQTAGCSQHSLAVCLARPDTCHTAVLITLPVVCMYPHQDSPVLRPPVPVHQSCHMSVASSVIQRFSRHILLSTGLHCYRSTSSVTCLMSSVNALSVIPSHCRVLHCNDITGQKLALLRQAAHRRAVASG